MKSHLLIKNQDGGKMENFPLFFCMDLFCFVFKLLIATAIEDQVSSLLPFSLKAAVKANAG